MHETSKNNHTVWVWHPPCSRTTAGREGLGSNPGEYKSSKSSVDLPGSQHQSHDLDLSNIKGSGFPLPTEASNHKCTTRIGIHCLPVSSVFSGFATLKIHGKKPSKSTKWSSNSNLLELSHWCPWKSGWPRSHSWVWRVAKSNTYI